MTAALATTPPPAAGPVGPVRLLPGDAPEEEWLTVRQAGIGGSDIAGILNLSKWSGPLMVWQSKVHGWRQPVNDAMEIGTALEPWILTKYARNHPELELVKKPGTFADPAAPWRMVTPDGLGIEGGKLSPTVLVEAKTACLRGDNPDIGWGEAGTDEVPYGYLCQVSWACLIMGCSRWELPVLFDGHEYREYRGVYAPSLGELLATRIGEWRESYVVRQVEPPADGLEATRRLLADHHRAPRKSSGQLPPEALSWRETYHALSAEIKELEGQKRTVGNLLRQAHNEAGVEVGLVGTEKVSVFSRIANGTVRLDVKGATPS